MAIDREFLNLEKQLLPDSVLEKCAAMSARPNSISELHECLRCKIINLRYL